MQYVRAVCIFLWDIFIFLFPGYTQHILKVWKKYICNFLKYSKINTMGSFLTPGWATVCVKKIISEIQKNINLSLWIFIYKGRCKASVSSSFRRRYKGGTFVQRRAALPRSGLSSSVQVALEAVLGELPRAERSLGARAPTKKRICCGLCIRSNN